LLTTLADHTAAPGFHDSRTDEPALLAEGAVFLRRQAFYKDFLASLWLSGNLPLQ
jgi:hypothetical protein